MASLGCLNHLEALSPTLVLFGVSSALLVIVEQIPQYVKIIQNKSAEGLSATTLAIGNVASAFNVINLTILHANQIKLCFTDMPHTLQQCQPSLLVLHQGLTGFMACFPFYWLKLHYNRKGIEKRKGMWGLFFQVMIIIIGAIPAVWSILPSGSCGDYRGYANTIGFLNTILLCSQFVPQIYTSCKYKGSGAISYITFGLDAGGGFVMVAYRIFGTKERLSSWLPYLVFHTSELVVILVAAYYDYFAGYRSKCKHKESLESLPYEPSGVSSSEGSPLIKSP